MTKLSGRTQISNADVASNIQDLLFHVVKVGSPNTSWRVEWKQLGHKLFADASARSSDTPVYAGQLGAQLDTNVIYISTGTSAGNWKQLNLFEEGAGTSSLKSINATAASGNYSIAIGDTANASGDSANAIGDDASANIDKTTQINGPIIIKKDSGESDLFQNFGGALVCIATDEIDMKTTGDILITLPTGCRFFTDLIYLIVTDADTVTGQPTIRAGITSNLTKLRTASVTSGLTSQFDQNEFTVSSKAGEATLTFGVTSAATATTMKCRAIFRGLLIENE